MGEALHIGKNIIVKIVIYEREKNQSSLREVLIQIVKKEKNGGWSIFVENFAPTVQFAISLAQLCETWTNEL